MERCRIVVLCVYILLCRSGAFAQGALVSLLPAEKNVPGWTVKEPPKTFSGDHLFDYMDGAAEIPRSYSFRQLASCKYQKGGTVLEAAVFDMGSSADAFGYYSARSFLERNPRSKEKIVPLDHPAHLYASVGVLTFWKDRYTIILQPDSGKPDEATLSQFARALSAKINAKGSPPDLLRRLPTAKRVANSERFVRGKAAFDALLMFLPKDVFGMSNGSVAVAAEYNLSGGTATLFILSIPTGSIAGVLHAYHDYLVTRKAVFTSSTPDGLLATSPREKGTAAAKIGNLLGVVVGAKDAKSAASGLSLLRQAQRLH